MSIFKAKTTDAYVIRNLIDLLQNNLKTACVELDSTGISMCMQDSFCSTLISFKLDAEKFNSYKLDKMIYAGLNLKHLHKTLKSVKKKDILEFFIESENPKELGSHITTKEYNKTISSFIQIQEIQNFDIDVPTDYVNSIAIQSGDIQKLLKEMTCIGNLIKISSSKTHIQFSCNDGDIVRRCVKFGAESEEEFSDIYDISHISKIIKISSLDNVLTIFTKKGLPLLMTSNIGSLGKINIYIKSKRQIELDKKDA